MTLAWGDEIVLRSHDQKGYVGTKLRDFINPCYAENLRRTTSKRPATPDANRIRLPGSGVVPVPLAEPRMVNDSEGIVPTELLEASDGPLFESQKTGSPVLTTPFCRFNQ